MSNQAARQIARYRSLVEATAVFARTASTSDLLGAVHAQVRRLFTAPVTVLARLEEGGSWNCLTLEGEDTHDAVLPPQADGLFERVARGVLTQVGDLPDHLRREELRGRHLTPGVPLPQARSWMGVPLSREGRVIGVLSVQSYEPGTFDDEDLEFLTLLATHLSITLEKAALHERLAREARTDPLTGLLNRRAFAQLSAQAQGRATRTGQPVTLALLDVQRFKDINDGYGHPVGDRVLGTLGPLLGAQVRVQDSVFRLGGDEFALLIEQPHEVTCEVMRRILWAIEHHPWPMSGPLHLNIGLAEWQSGQSVEDWLRAADDQMYGAKRQGRAL